ncbi:MAG: hypothetical protein LBI84_10540 [Propionibacteriaceae bacterium]|jgi:hypothetical protein|nr:hypothetical protein [Propionibacteriaceae bacterium]
MPIQHPTTDSFHQLTGKQLKPILETIAQVTWPIPEAGLRSNVMAVAAAAKQTNL